MYAIRSYYAVPTLSRCTTWPHAGRIWWLCDHHGKCRFRRLSRHLPAHRRPACRKGNRDLRLYSRRAYRITSYNVCYTKLLRHDLGHTPFGHAGERVLNELSPNGFHHVRQSLRVVDVLEKEGAGLNLTYEVRDGILKHSKGQGSRNNFV